VDDENDILVLSVRDDDDEVKGSSLLISIPGGGRSKLLVLPCVVCRG
jgi:hypothetical protein